MKRTYFKTVRRTVAGNFGRFLSITLIILLGVAFVTGLGTLSHKLEGSLSRWMNDSEIADVIVKSSSAEGFGSAQIEAIEELERVAAVQPVTALDLELDGRNSRIYVMPAEDVSVNRPELISGRFPSASEEIAVERSSDFVREIAIGEKLTVFGTERTVVGIVANPLLSYRGGEPDLILRKELEQILYLDSGSNVLPLPVTDLFVRWSGVDRDLFSKAYRNFTEDGVAELKRVLQSAGESGETFSFLTLEENSGYAMAKSYADKIDVITLIFPVFFIAVAALVVLTTVTRMIEEERTAIGCYKTLGFGDGKVAMKYVGFSLLCTILGGGIGIGLGMIVLPLVIYPAFNVLFFMPEMIASFNLTMGWIAALGMLAAVAGVTLFLVKRELRGQPANLLRPKAPKAGKKTFLERIPFLWNRLSFRYKSTFRNIFRYVRHLVMTVISVAGSAALILAGLGLSDLSKNGTATGGGSLANIAESLSLIAAVVIVFAALLCVLVIFNLTNMNIGERKREIATLKVLGYHDREVSGYIFREIFIMTLFGIAIGIPLGYGLLYFVFAYLDFGAIGDVRWYSYLLTAAFVIVSVGLVDAMLAGKIRRVDMTSSLKTAD